MSKVSVSSGESSGAGTVSRRAVLAAAAGLAAGAFLSACRGGNRPPVLPTNPSSPSASPTPSVREPKVLDLTKQESPGPRSVAATKAAGAVLRLWVDNGTGNLENSSRHNVLSAVHIGLSPDGKENLFLTAGHFNLDETEQKVELPNFRARLAAVVGGQLTVLHATRFSNLYNPNDPIINDIAMLAVPSDQVPAGLEVARPAGPRDVQGGMLLHMAGFAPRPGTGRFDNRIDVPTEQAGSRGALLSGSIGVDFQMLAKLGRNASEGPFVLDTTAMGMSGGGVFTDGGLNLGLVTHEGEPITLGLAALSDGFDIVRTPNAEFHNPPEPGDTLSQDTMAESVRCVGREQITVDRLISRLALIPAP